METLIFGSGPWATMDTGAAGPRDAETLKDPGLKSGWAILARDGVIVESGPEGQLLPRHDGIPKIDLGPRLVTPGFVDPHTHPVFAATREDEFGLRLEGKSYVEIAQAGGGILNSARRLREMSLPDLIAGLEERADGFLRLGTTTIEAKSGYGLSTEAELRSLEAIQAVDSRHPLDLHATFLGAHEIPLEYRPRREEYMSLLLDEMLPEVARRKLATACDVFCEEHVFSIDESRRILLRAKELGLAVKLHADEIHPTGGAELAAEVGALSADHLVAISDEGIRRMGEASVIPILLPGTSLFLGLPNDAPGRKMMDAGLSVALATDYNPGSCPTRNLPLIMTLACLHYGMTPAQALGASTWNAAHAMGVGGVVGGLGIGFKADLVAFDLPNLESLPYRFGENAVAIVVKSGQIVVEGAQLRR